MERKVVRVGRIGENGKALDALTVGRGSSLEFELAGVPDSADNVQLHVGRPGASVFTAIPASPLPDGRWAVYASGLNFPEEGKAKYHVTGRDARGGSIWLGSGRLNVEPSVLNVDGEAVPIVPEDAYVRNPETGLWHRLTVGIEDGVLVPSVSEQGVSR